MEIFVKESEPYQDEEVEDIYPGQGESENDSGDDAAGKGKVTTERLALVIEADKDDNDVKRRRWIHRYKYCSLVFLALLGLLLLELLSRKAVPSPPSLQTRAATILLPQLRNQMDHYTFTNIDLVEKFGFPMQWEDCTMTNLLRTISTQGRPLRIVVLGGSASATSPADCDYNNTKDLNSQRWTNMLQENLEEDLQINVSMVNVAQGDTTSEFNGLTIDRRINPSAVDILIIEFCINDFDFGGGNIRARIELFLRRTWAHFHFHKQKLPPILNVCLWNQNVGDRDPNLLASEGFHSTTLEKQWSVLQRYQSEGWNLQTIHVGATIDETIVANNVRLLFADKHHPNCAGCHFIANMVQTAIYRNLAQSSNCDSKYSHQVPTLPPVDNSTIPRKAPLVAYQLHQLQPHMARRTASFSSWKPNISPTGDLQMDQDYTTKLEPLLMETGKYSPYRADRKLSYLLPYCNDTNATHLQFTLREPTLEWLGLVYYWYSRFGGDLKGQQVMATINGAQIALEGNDDLTRGCYRRVNRWIQLADFGVVGDGSYTLSLCRQDHNHTDHNLYLHFLIAVMQQ